MELELTRLSTVSTTGQSGLGKGYRGIADEEVGTTDADIFMSFLMAIVQFMTCAKQTLIKSLFCRDPEITN